MFTPEELAQLRAYDAQVDETPLTMDEIKETRERDKAAVYSQKDAKAKRKSDENRKYRESHKAEMAEYKRQYYATRKEEKAEYDRAYKQKNMDRVKENSRLYYQANRERLLEKARMYREKRRREKREGNQSAPGRCGGHNG